MYLVNKARVEAFTDAVVAIIMTIMVLEFKTPESPQWTAILHEGPYLFAFGVSFLFIAVAWYNHHYMFSLADRISKRVYWLNIAWLFAMSLLPVATAWAGRYLQARAPEYFYLLVFFLWSKTYLYLSMALATDLDATNGEKAARIRRMPIFRFMQSWRLLTQTVVVGILIYFYPPSCLLVTSLELIYMAIHTTPDSDKIAG